ncbi:MAG: DUF1800 domain-containing protein [Lewinellaceae bacterium]|nr:DUF1800 domain-containing protein [Lewinellaceae bacterium]
MAAHTDLSTERAAAPPPPVSDSLDPYIPSAGKPWDARRVAHLYRRLGYGATHDQIQQGLQMTPSALVDLLLDTAAALPAPTPPYWADWDSEDYAPFGFDKTEEHRREMRHRWMTDMLGEGVRAKMAFFWHNHFVTKLIIYGCNAYLWRYYLLLHEKALGNFRDFVVEMGKNPAMLVFLNGNLNVVGNPNENYARELMELFTMGENNGYTQQDVVEMARALTGWTASFNDCTPAAFDPARFDNSDKTIFGVTDNFDPDGAHLHIFSARANEVSHFIAGKIYRHYVHQEETPAVIAGLAETFRDNDWELLPMLKQLFKSEHFFEQDFLNAKLKSPVETFIPVLKMAGVTNPAGIPPEWWNDITFWIQKLGQEFFIPPNVAGWQEHRSWINESTLTARWNYATIATYFLSQDPQLQENLRTIAKALTNNSKDPAVVTAAMVDYFTGQTLEPLYLQAATAYFKSGVPENYFTGGIWSLDFGQAPGQIINLLQYLVRMPEFQLT